MDLLLDLIAQIRGLESNTWWDLLGALVSFAGGAAGGYTLRPHVVRAKLALRSSDFVKAVAATTYVEVCVDEFGNEVSTRTIRRARPPMQVHKAHGRERLDVFQYVGQRADGAHIYQRQAVRRVE